MKRSDGVGIFVLLLLIGIFILPASVVRAASGDLWSTIQTNLGATAWFGH